MVAGIKKLQKNLHRKWSVEFSYTRDMLQKNKVFGGLKSDKRLV